ncbi:glycosyltransferase family 4 protein [Vibrio parahaemolyticus]|uniref:glycosyltransferase family 4 protein n=1 Tax=Vibrio parahaemolyticus TaxID=670 RepID=UPI00061B59EC|nr:glycosyltransferase family 4 protein [Vibrio parahaemolyticus]EGQ8231796.1 glycosyltransferase [Vibrio parahaemolyticus]EJG1163674.1 glycosyltransferase family 4 protein [Vibrio parahaemolyticus]EJL8301863.1 glycosyltransferase family 4 protein [Vibrio parahaemolyticus]KKC92082.1 hypothetical protein WR36_01400 [Vibrio parahaemolyticus]HAS6585542.1 glycosyltransferase [Vibrio parahaemolyticus]
MSNKKIFIIGPFPEPVHGMSLANKYLLEFLKKHDEFDVSFFDISIGKKIKNKSSQGVFEINYFLKSIINTLSSLLFVFSNRGSFAYITPPQSALGFLRLLPVLFFSKIFCKKTIIHFHGSRLIYNYRTTNILFRKLVNIGLALVDNVIFLGDSIRKEHLELIPTSKSIVCWNGVECPVFHEQEYSNKVKVLFFSNLMKDKGIFDFLDAVKLLDSKCYEVHIAGNIEPCFENEINVKLSKLSNLVTYHGPLFDKDKEVLFSKANIFVLPSYDEGQPLSILEAYSYGCTVVTTKVGGIPDIFNNNVNGRYCQLGNPNDIAEKILSFSNDELNTFKSYNKKFYLDNFTKESFCHRIVQLIG